MTLAKKVLGLSLAAVIGMATQARADDTPSGKKASLEQRIAELEAKLKDAQGGGVKGSGIKVSGYVDTSYTVNLADRDNNSPLAGSSAQNTGRVFDNQYDAFNLNAVKLTIQKDKDTSKFPAGFRVDTILGEDAAVLTRSKAGTGATGAAGVNAGDSSLYLEQAYVNLGIPIGNGIDVKIGKMVSLMGYEVIESPANWQFSRSDAFRLEPLTQTGVSLGYQFNDTVTLTAAVINGVDSITGAVATSGGLNYNTSLGGVARLDVNGPKTSFGDFNAFAAGLYSNDNTGATASNDQNISAWNIGGNWDKPFGVKQMTWGTEYLQRLDQVTAGTINSSIGASVLSVYGKWDWNKWLTSSGRFSYSRYDNANQLIAGVATSQTLSPLTSPVGNTSLPAHTDVYSFTLTQAFNVWKDTLVRLEWRHDWTQGGEQGFGVANGTAGATRNDIRQDQDTIAVNVVYSF